MTVTASVIVNALAASILVNAGVVKLASPRGMLRALHELFQAASVVDTRLVRVFAAVEVAVGLGLLAAPIRTSVSVVLAGLGLCFAILGVAGWRSGSKAPCGCMGEHSGSPLGATNVAVGLALVCVLPANMLLGERSAAPFDDAQWTVLATAFGSLLLCLWMNRSLALNLLRPAGFPVVGEETP